MNFRDAYNYCASEGMKMISAPTNGKDLAAFKGNRWLFFDVKKIPSSSEYVNGAGEVVDLSLMEISLAAPTSSNREYCGFSKYGKVVFQECGESSNIASLVVCSLF